MWLWSLKALILLPFLAKPTTSLSPTLKLFPFSPLSLSCSASLSIFQKWESKMRTRSVWVLFIGKWEAWLTSSKFTLSLSLSLSKIRPSLSLLLNFCSYFLFINLLIKWLHKSRPLVQKLAHPMAQSKEEHYHYTMPLHSTFLSYSFFSLLALISHLVGPL